MRNLSISNLHRNESGTSTPSIVYRQLANTELLPQTLLEQDTYRVIQVRPQGFDRLSQSLSVSGRRIGLHEIRHVRAPGFALGPPRRAPSDRLGLRSDGSSSLDDGGVPVHQSLAKISPCPAAGERVPLGSTGSGVAEFAQQVEYGDLVQCISGSQEGLVVIAEPLGGV